MIKKVDLLDFSSNSLKFQQLFILKMNQLILYKMFKKKNCKRKMSARFVGYSGAKVKPFVKKFKKK